MPPEETKNLLPRFLLRRRRQVHFGVDVHQHDGLAVDDGVAGCPLQSHK